MYSGTAKRRKKKLGSILKIVFGINSPVNNINIVEIIDCISTIKASWSTKCAIHGSNKIAICKPYTTNAMLLPTNMVEINWLGL